MAKKKKKRYRGRKSTRRSSGPKAKPAGLAGGMALSAMDMFYQPLYYLSVTQYDNAKIALKKNVVDPQKYKYALAGALISASPRIPLVGIIAKPVDKGLKALSKKKWGL